MTTFRRPAVKRSWAAAATLILVPTLAACGFSVQTNQQYQSAAGADSLQQTAEITAANSASPVQVYNAAVVIAKKGDTSGSFVGSFVNNTGPNAIAGYTTDGQLKDNGVTATVASVAVGTAAQPTTISLAPNAAYHPQPLNAAGNQPPIPVTVPADVPDGGYVTMTFTIVEQATNKQYTVTMKNVPVFLGDTAESFLSSYVSAAPAPAPSPNNSTSPAANDVE